MNINTGPLTREVYEICLLNEKQAARPEQTAVAIRLSALGNAVETMERENGVAAETLVKVNAWIAEAKPLLERGGKAETALTAADSDRESLRALVVRLKEALGSSGLFSYISKHADDCRKENERVGYEVYKKNTFEAIKDDYERIEEALSLVPADLAECCVVRKGDIEPGGKYILRGIYEVAAKQRTDLLEAMREIVVAKTLGDAVVLAIQARNPEANLTALRETGRGGE